MSEPGDLEYLCKSRLSSWRWSRAQYGTSAFRPANSPTDDSYVALLRRLHADLLDQELSEAALMSRYPGAAEAYLLYEFGEGSGLRWILGALFEHGLTNELIVRRLRAKLSPRAIELFRAFFYAEVPGADDDERPPPAAPECAVPTERLRRCMHEKLSGLRRGINLASMRLFLVRPLRAWQRLDKASFLRRCREELRASQPRRPSRIRRLCMAEPELPKPRVEHAL